MDELYYQGTHSGPEIDALLDTVDAGVTPIIGKGINLLDNWYFVGGGSQQGGGQFPINQRGQSSYPSAGYGIDRWESAGQAVLNSGYITIPGAVNFYQKIPFDSQFIGVPLTASVLTGNNELITGTTIITDTSTNYYYAGVGNDELIVIGFFGSTSPMIFYLQGRTSGNHNYVAVKLELGDTQTLARQVNGTWVLNDPAPNYQQELAKCQRYQLVINTAQYFLPFNALAQQTDLARVIVPLPVSLRSKPTISFIVGSAADFGLYNGLESKATTGFTVYMYTASEVTLNASATGLTVGGAYQLIKNTPGDATILLDANL